MIRQSVMAFAFVCVAVLACPAGEPPAAQDWVSYCWPAQAGMSDRYKVFVRCGAGPEREAQVLMSRALGQGDYREAELAGRTFSFATLSYNPGAGPLTIRNHLGNARCGVARQATFDRAWG